MIGERLKALRIARGIKTKRDAATLFEMPYTTYNNYEIGSREPGSKELIKFATYYGVSVNFLLGLDEKKEKPATSESDGSGNDRTDLLTALEEDLIGLDADSLKTLVRFAAFLKSEQNK